MPTFQGIHPLYKVNISIDDVTPWERSSTKVLDRCNELIAVFPDIKFTLFVPTNYWRTIPPTNTPHAFMINTFRDFCEELKTLPVDNYEIAFHGHNHGIPHISNNDEFGPENKFLKTIVGAMMTRAHCSGINFEPVFRPPAWKITNEAQELLFEKGIHTIAGCKEYPYEEHPEMRHIYATCYPPRVPLKFEDETMIVYHACEWDSNFLDVTKTQELIEFLKTGITSFSFIGEMDGKV